ncbi:MAG: MBL fold metallo-hydrolase [Candidatus Omnitrophota bacterium]
MNNLKTIVVGNLGVNCYILFSNGQALIIDPGGDFGLIQNFLTKNNLVVKFIVHTHGHFDHIGADNKFNVPVYIHRLDVECLTDSSKNLSNFVVGNDLKIKSPVVAVDDGEKIYLDEIILKVIHTPGHTKGGICLLWEEAKCIFTGDTLFYEGIGRTDFPGASHEELINSIEKKLFILEDNIICYPGHGPKTTIGHEKKNNPFLGG